MIIIYFCVWIASTLKSFSYVRGALPIAILGFMLSGDVASPGLGAQQNAAIKVRRLMSPDAGHDWPEMKVAAAEKAEDPMQEWLDSLSSKSLRNLVDLAISYEENGDGEDFLKAEKLYQLASSKIDDSNKWSLSSYIEKIF